MVLAGAGTVKDAARAATLFQKGCDGGDVEGCVDLGEAYEKGEGVTESFGEAVELYDRACNGGSAEGCRQLGEMYSDGRGVARSPMRSVDLWSRACDGADYTACVELAKLYATGRGVRVRPRPGAGPLQEGVRRGRHDGLRRSAADALKGPPPHHSPWLGIDAQGSFFSSASPRCKSSTEWPSGDFTNAMRPSRGGRRMATPLACSASQVA